MIVKPIIVVNIDEMSRNLAIRKSQEHHGVTFATHYVWHHREGVTN